MNWFERYGIPGLYFGGLMACWVYALCPQIIRWKDFDALPGVIAALIAVSLPIGYIMSITGQVVYLNWRCCLFRWRRLRRCFGFHGAALDDVEPENGIRDEAIIEAGIVLLTASRNGALSVDTHQYIRNWIARRMDVVAINQSLFLATILAPMVATVFWWTQECPFPIAALILLIPSAVVIILVSCSIHTLRRQVIKVIAGIYRTYR